MRTPRTLNSTIGTLRQDLKKQFNWPIEMNYATLKSNPPVNLSIISKSYKTLIEDWGNHMKKMDKSDEHKNTFTQNMENNTYLNFTKFIQQEKRESKQASKKHHSNFPLQSKNYCLLNKKLNFEKK